MIPRLKLFVFICAAVLIVACSKTEPKSPSIVETPTPFIVVPVNSILCSYEESSQSIPYYVENGTSGKLSAKASQAWITNISVGDGAVSFRVKENPEQNTRVAQITLEYPGAKSISISIEQKYVATTILVTPTSTEFGYAGGNGSFSYTVNNPRAGVEMTVSSSVNWITILTKTSGGVTFSVAENNSGSAREGKIVLSYGNYATGGFTVYQSWSGPEIILTPTSTEIGYAGGSSSFSYTVNNPRAGVEMTVSSNASWITILTKTSGGVTFSVAENNSGSAREGKIVLSYGNYATGGFTVYQSWSGPEIILTPTSTEIGHAGGGGSFSYTINNPRAGVELTVSSSVSWITILTKTSGGVTFSVAKNNSGSAREGKIILSYGNYATAEFNIQQSGPNITLNKSELNLFVGDTEQLVATVNPAGLELIWSSSDPTVASVDSNGLVKGIKMGTSIITVNLKNSDVSSSCKVIVIKFGGITEGIGEEIWK